MESLISIIDDSEDNLISLNKEHLFKEFLRLRCTDNQLGMGAIVEAYLKWYNRDAKPSYRRRTDVLEMFDFLAGVFDYHCLNIEVDNSVLNAESLLQTYNVGPMKRFFRNALDYHPDKYAMNCKSISRKFIPYELDHVKILDELWEQVN